MRSEGFPFIVWGSGAWTRVRFVCCVPARSSRVASRHRESRCVASRCVVNSVPCGSASRARRVCGVGGAVPWGLLLGRSRGCRCAVGICVSGASRVWRGWCCAMGIAAGQVVWVALCRGDLRLGRVACVAWVALCHGVCCWAGRVGGAVPCGLLLGASRGWHCAMGIATGRVAWVAVCHGDCCRACRVGGAVPWGLRLGVSLGWRCAMGIAAGRVAGAVLCHGDCWWACRVGGAVSWGLLTRASSGWRRVLGMADQGLVWVAPCLWDC